MSRLTATAPPGGRRRTSNPGWPRGPPPVGASRRDLPTGCARRSPERSPGDGGSIPPTSTNRNVVLLEMHILRRQLREERLTGQRPSPVRLTASKPSRARIDGRAGIERIGSSEARPYVVAWGGSPEEDEDRLRTRVAAPADADVTVDLCEVEEVTDEGCAAIKNVAEDMGCRGQSDSLREDAAWGYV